MFSQQPKALYTLFLTELWERYGFYVLQGLLVLFFTQHFAFSQHNANLLYGEFTALVYISPLIGGLLADKCLGFRRATIFGAIMLMFGYGLISVAALPVSLFGIAAVVVGNGLLKPNISSFLGSFYAQNDVRREAGFTIFYIGINIGSLIATQTSGFIARYWGWSACFGVAVLGLLLALAIFIFGYRYYDDLGKSVSGRAWWQRCLLSPSIFTILLFAAVGIIYLPLQYPLLGNFVLNIVGVVLLCALVFKALKLRGVERSRFWLLIILVLASVVFWGLFFQLFSSVIFFISALVNPHVFNINMPANAFVSLEPFFVITLGYVLARLWQRLTVRKSNPGYGTKFVCALVAIAVSFAVLWFSIMVTPVSMLVSAWWLVLGFFFLTLGELLLSPIGLAMIIEFAPSRWHGAMMGVWFVSLGFGGEFSGALANLSAMPEGVHTVIFKRAQYAHAFAIYTGLGLVAAVVLWFALFLYRYYHRDV